MVPQITDLPPNMQSKIQVSTQGCWEWTGALNSRNYGCIAVRTVSHLSHRVAYELLVESIPEELQIDHLCRNTICCNPAHLEPVTQLENRRRCPDYHRSECKHGHAMTPENTIIKKRANGREERNCRTCAAEYLRRLRRKRAA